MTKKIVNEIKSVVKNRKKEPRYDAQAMIKSLQDQVDYLFGNADKVNNRIDRIVEAIDKSKKVRGL
jgi:peptidoglycan hydrolase CwlO-like protein